MDLKKFREKLFDLQPDLNDLLNEGYSKEGAIEIINNEYILKSKNIQNQYNSPLLDFLNNYDLEFFTIRNISFDDILRYVNDHLLIGGFDGGYLGLNENSGHIYIIYADEIDNINTLFAENESQFFDILLIFAEYSSKGTEDEIDKYIERCESICVLGNYDLFF